MMNPRRDKIVALLPMKANSERVKGKNFRVFQNKPLFRWILDTLLALQEIDKVVINTDARQLLADNGLVESDRVLIRDRRATLCGDLVSMNLILEDDVKHVPADLYLMTHTTNPLMSAATVKSAIQQFQQAQRQGIADSLFSVNRMQTRFYHADASPVNHDPNNLVRTQDLEPWFEENSNLYLFTADSFHKTRARIGRQPILFVSPKIEAFDIDNQEDWDLALIAAQYLQHHKAAS
jgi:CMP-N-acetylneuraminic acid synthetase